MLAGSAASPFQPQQHLRNAVSARLRRLRCPNPNTSTGAGRRSSLTTFADARWFRRIPPGGLRWPCARCLGADDCGRTGGGCAGDLHDASQPRRWRRRRHAADRPFRRRAACRRSPTLSRVRQRPASPTRSRRGLRITSSSSAGRARSTERASPSSCTCCGSCDATPAG